MATPRFLEYRRVNKKLRQILSNRENKRGLLIVFEGPDGAGKTTQRKLFKNWLRSEGYEVDISKWNSSDLLKPIMKARKTAHALNPNEFCLLHAADFRHRLETEILPALWKGRMVIADRYFFTALARDSARGLDLDWIMNAYVPLFWPDLVFYFAVSPTTSIRRTVSTHQPTFYEAGQDVTGIASPMDSFRQFEERCIQEYEALAKIFQFVKVDAETSIFEQHQMIRGLFKTAVKRPWAEWNVEAVLDWLARKKKIMETKLA